MYSTKLEVVNACIATMGEAPLNSLEEEHVYKQAALDYLSGSNKALQKKGWWFNKEIMKLLPDATSKFIYLPQNTLEAERADERDPVFAQRGRRLYDPILNRYEWDHELYPQVIVELNFEDLPYHAQDAVALSAILRFQREYDGDNTRTNQLNADRGRAELELNAQHIRQLKVNMLNPVRVTMASYGMRRPNQHAGLPTR